MESSYKPMSPQGIQCEGRDDQPVRGPGDDIGEGDSSIIVDFLPFELSEVAFKKVLDEVKWNTMFHRGGEVPRLVAVEGQVDADGRRAICLVLLPLTS